MYCSKCGANVPQGAAFCSVCGQPVPATSAVPPAPPASTPPSQLPPPTPYPPAAPVYAPPAQAAWQTSARPVVAYAGFWLRFVAFIIDAIVLYFVGTIITLPFLASMGLRGIMRGHMPLSPEEWMPYFGALIRLALIRTVLNWLYYALLESSSWQGTLGKKALGLEVTDLEGRRISFGRATGRFFAKIISALILWIGFIMAGFTEKKQALHDMIAGTLVIRKL
jgi:uncharacterized RDD family membrane protein YckC